MEDAGALPRLGLRSGLVGLFWMLWVSCHAKTFNSEGAVDDKKIGAGEKTGKLYGKLATPHFFSRIAPLYSIAPRSCLHPLCRLCRRRRVSEKVKSHPRSSSMRNRKTSTHPPRFVHQFVHLSNLIFFCLILSYPFFVYLILSCPIHLSPLLTSPSNPSWVSTMASASPQESEPQSRVGCMQFTSTSWREKHGDTFSKGPCVWRHSHPELRMQKPKNWGFFDFYS